MGSKIGRGLIDLGEGIASLAIKQMEQEREATRVSQAIEARTWMNELYSGAIVSTQNTPYEKLNEADPLGDVRKRTDEYLGTIQDRELRTLVEKERSSLDITTGNKIREIRFSKTREHQQGVSIKNTQQGINRIVDAEPDGIAYQTTPQAWDAVITEIEGARASEFSTGIWTAEQHNKIIRDFYKEAATGLIAKDPLQGAAFLKLYKDRIDPTALKVMQNDVKSSIQQNIRDLAYTSLYKQTGGNFGAMTAALDDPDNMKNLGLTLEDASYVKGFITRVQEAKDKQTKALWDKTATDVFLNLATQTPRKIDQLVGKGELSYQMGEHFKKELKETAKVETDPRTYDRFLQSIYKEDQDPQTLRDQIIRSTSLGREDKERLLTKTQTSIEKDDARNLSRAIQYLKETVKPSETMITAAKPEEALNYMKAAEAMEAAVMNARKEGKPLTPKQVIEKAQELSQTFRLTPREQIDAATARIKAEAEKVVKPTPQKAEPVKTKTRLKWNPAKGDFE